jgi:hypothetical protein
VTSAAGARPRPTANRREDRPRSPAGRSVGIPRRRRRRLPDRCSASPSDRGAPRASRTAVSALARPPAPRGRS